MRASVSTTSEAVRGEQRREVARELRLDVGVHVVGRVDQHEIVLPARARLRAQSPEGVAAHDPRARQAQLVEVPLDRRAASRVVLDEDGARGAARERLEPHRARARVEVEHGRAVDRPEDVEDVLAHAVRRRPCPSPRGAWIGAPAGAGDDPHARIVASRRGEPSGLRSQTARPIGRRLSAVGAAGGGGAQRARLARRARPPRPHGRPRRRGARPLEQRPVAAEVREAEVGEAGLARAEQLAAAAQLEVDLGELEAVGRVARAPGAAPAPSRSAPPSRRETSRQYDCSAPRPTRPRSWWSCARPKRSASCTIITVAFGTSTPTSITVVATSTSSSRALKRAIRSRRSAGFSRPCRQPTRKSRSSARRSRSASSSAARASVVSDASTSGQTTYACRPSREQARQPRVRLGRALLA